MSLNPKKMLEKAIGETSHDLGRVLESIHAHLELMLEEQKKTNEWLEKIYFKGK